jgi:integrase/recombinase XerD
VTHLRKMMLDELQRRNYAQSTAEAYVRALRDFAGYYHLPPDRLGPEQIRQFQLHMLRDRGLSAKTVKQGMAAVRFFFVHTLKRSYPRDEFPYPKTPRRLPIVLSQEEVRLLIDAASDLFHRAMLMTLYSTGMRRAELIRLKVSNIDSQRMVIHIQRGKGGKDRDVPLSPKLLETLREYWRWMKPQTYLFPSRSSRRKGLHITARAESGSIYFDHQDLSHLDIQAVRQQIGVVLQSGRLLGASLYQNLIGSAPLTIDDAWAAARMAGLEADIKAMPMGMHTVIAEGGGGLSGGQR